VLRAKSLVASLFQFSSARFAAPQCATRGIWQVSRGVRCPQLLSNAIRRRPLNALHYRHIYVIFVTSRAIYSGVRYIRYFHDAG